MHEADAQVSPFSLPSKVRPIDPGTCFGDLVVIEPANPYIRNNGRRAAASICRCSCGTERRYRNNGLRRGFWQSCGCKQKINAAEGRVTHGHARGGKRSPELTAWRMMLRRCNDPKNKDYHNYGGRGIKVCPEWLNSFEAFFAHIGLKPDPSYSIDRIDVNGHYEPGNVRWADKWTQANNKRRNAA